MAKKITYKEVMASANGERDDVVTRDITWSDRDSRMGKSTVVTNCPFCKSEIEAYIWSLAGGGKRCDCGALTSYYGYAYQFKDQVEAAEAERDKLEELRRTNKKGRKKIKP